MHGKAGRDIAVRRHLRLVRCTLPRSYPEGIASFSKALTR